MSRILLLRPPAVFSATTYTAPITMPVGPAYLSAALRDKGHQVDIIDALGEDLDHIGVSFGPRVRYRGLSNKRVLARMASLPAPDAVGITCMFSQDWPHIEDMILAIAGRFPGLPIILGGEHATAAAEYLLASCPPVRYVARGEGEETIVDFADFLDGRRHLKEVDGVWWRDDRGAVVKNPPRARVRHPDELPWPAWDICDLDPYFAAGEGCGVERGRTMPLLATRGCPYQCTFCSSPSMWTTRYVMRDPAKVIDEIAHYIQRYRVENIDFYDLTAVVKKAWILSLCAEIGRRGLKFSWQLPSGTRSEALDDDTLQAMAESGCMNVAYAPESGSPAVLEDIKKKVKLPRLFESARAAKRRGLSVKCNLIIAFPRETRADMWKTVWAAIRFAFLGVDDVGIFIYSPYPGTELYEYLRSTRAISRMDRGYFEGLMASMDLSRVVHYCENVGAIEIAAYRLFGMTAFYGLSYLLRPWRVLRSWRNYKTQRSDTQFENRLFGLLRRRRIERAWRMDEIAA